MVTKYNTRSQILDKGKIAVITQMTEFEYGLRITQYSVTAYMGKESKKEWIRVYV